MEWTEPRTGGVAAWLSVAALIPAFALLLTLDPGGGAERSLGNFEQQPGVLAATMGLFILSQALYMVFFVGLYQSTKDHARTIARVSLGTGIGALALGMVSIHLMVAVIHLLGPSQTSGSLAGTEALEALYLGINTLAMAGGTALVLFVGLAIFGFGTAMVPHPRFSMAFAAVTMAAGGFVFISVLLSLFPLPVLAMYGYAALGGSMLLGQAAGSGSAASSGESTD